MLTSSKILLTIAAIALLSSSVIATSDTGFVNVDLGECGDCDGKLTTLSLKYLGNTPIHVVVFQQKVGTPIFEGDLVYGDTMDLVGEGLKNTLGTDVTIHAYENGVETGFEESIKIHTSCSQVILIGDLFSAGLVTFRVEGASSLNGGDVCVGDCATYLDFSEDCSGNALQAGDVVTSLECHGLDITVTKIPNPTLPDPPGFTPLPMIFDSNGVPSGEDDDLGVHIGNILIISEDNDASDPDDSCCGGSIVFEWDRGVDLDSIVVVDIDKPNNWIVAYRGDKQVGFIPIVEMGNGKYLLHDLSHFYHITKLTIFLSDSGAVTGLKWYERDCIPPPHFITECDACEGKLQYLQLQYVGPDQATVDVYQVKIEDYVVQDLVVDNSDLIDIYGGDDSGTLGTAIEVRVYIPEVFDDTIKIHTSCSEDLLVGDAFQGDGFKLVVTSGTSRINGDICDGDCTEVLIFDKNCDGQDLLSGDDVSTAFLSCNGLTIEAERDDGSSAIPMLFDSGAPTGGDEDLGYFDIGNILIISEDNVGTDPDDNQYGGHITFNFDHPVSFSKALIVDNEEGSQFDCYSGGVLVTHVDILAGSDGEILLYDISPCANVDKLVVSLSGSGAITGLKWFESGCFQEV